VQGIDALAEKQPTVEVEGEKEEKDEEGEEGQEDEEEEMGIPEFDKEALIRSVRIRASLTSADQEIASILNALKKKPPSEFPRFVATLQNAIAKRQHEYMIYYINKNSHVALEKAPPAAFKLPGGQSIEAV